MANPSANQVKIDLSGNLCLNELDCEVHSFEGFNERNTQILGNGLKPFYQHIDEPEEQVIYDRNEDKWTVGKVELESNPGVEVETIFKNDEPLDPHYSSLLNEEYKAQAEEFTELPEARDEWKTTPGKIYKIKGNGTRFFVINITENEIEIKTKVNNSPYYTYSYFEDYKFYDFVNCSNGSTLFIVVTGDRLFIHTLSGTEVFSVDAYMPSVSLYGMSCTECQIMYNGNKVPFYVIEYFAADNTSYKRGFIIEGTRIIINVININYKYLLGTQLYYGDYPCFYKVGRFTAKTDDAKIIFDGSTVWDPETGDVTGYTTETVADLLPSYILSSLSDYGRIICDKDTLCGLKSFQLIAGKDDADNTIPFIKSMFPNSPEYPPYSFMLQTGDTEVQTGVVYHLREKWTEIKTKRITDYSDDVWSDLRGVFNTKVEIPAAGEDNYNYNLLVNFNGDQLNVTGISFYNTLLTRWGGVDFSYKPVFSKEETDVTGVYNYTCQYVNENGHVRKIIVGTKIKLKLSYILNRYIVSNLININYSASTYNAYDIIKKEPFVYAIDWNNRLTEYKNTPHTWNKETFFSYASGSGMNLFENSLERSCQFPPIYCFCNVAYAYVSDYVKKTYQDNNVILYRVYKSKIDLYYSIETANPKYLISFKAVGKRYYDVNLADVLYTAQSNNNMYLSPDLLAEYKQLSNNDWTILSDDNTYVITKYDFENMLLYQIGTLIQDIDDIFSIQGQFYAIKNKTLFLVTISDGIITSNTIIYYLQDLQFIGATLQYALFYSPKQKSIYVFSGDRRLELLGPANEIDHVNTYFYDNSQNTIFIGCDKFILCFKDNYFWKIHIPEVTQFFFTDRGIEFIADGKVGLIHNYYHADDKAEMSVIPVNLETAFYGFGENRIGIIDCWNIRLFSKDKLSGNVKLKVTSLTDKGTVGEEATISIKESDWDDVTKTYLLRFQPRLQRGIGLSLAIVSDFELYDLQVSATPDSALQITERRVI